MDIGTSIIAVVGVIFAAGIRHVVRRARRARLIREFVFPRGIERKVHAKYEHLGERDLVKVMNALRDYFLVCHDAGKRVVAMPSQVVDVAWHEFILHTRQYQQFCHAAFGRFLHHTPAEAMASPTHAQDGIKRAWRLACAKDNIDRHQPTKLPLLFAIDGLLSIPDGFTYDLDCKGQPNRHCASHIGCGGGCSSGCSSDSSCSSGCGGD